MNPEMYTILSMLARYFFAGLMVLIVIRAWRATIVDSRRAKQLREWSPKTGCVGELIVNPGQKRRHAIPVPKEGVLGSARKSDIRIKLKDILPSHAHIEQREGGLLIRPLGKAQIALGNEGFTGEQLFARDGDILTIGKHKLMLVMFEPTPEPAFTETARHKTIKRNGAQKVPSESINKNDEFFQEETLWPDEKK